MALVNKGINPLMFPGLKTSITSDDSKAINFDEDCKELYHPGERTRDAQSNITRNTICGIRTTRSRSSVIRQSVPSQDHFSKVLQR